MIAGRLMKKKEDGPEYQSHHGLYMLSVELERIIGKIDKRRQKGWVADKKIVARLHELNSNLKALSKEWFRR